MTTQNTSSSSDDSNQKFTSDESIINQINTLEEQLEILKYAISARETLYEQPSNPAKADLLAERALASITSAKWDSRFFSRTIRISGFSFCTDGDKEDVCSYGIDTTGKESAVQFAQRIIRNNAGYIECDLVHSNAWRRVYVAVRASNCGNSWSNWEEVERI